MTNQSDAKTHKKPAVCSAGIVGLDLTPEDEKVALVLNITSKEVQLMPKKIAKRRRDCKDHIVGDAGDGENVIVEFNQPSGYGTPFGKMEDEDNNDPLATALRETTEESGMNLSERVFREIFHREKPQEWSSYFNIVFLGNCVGIKFRPELIADDFVDKNHSGFYHLFALPFREQPKRKAKKRQNNQREKLRAQPKPALYQAAIRRGVAILLQLDRNLLTELNRPGCDNADDLVKMVLARVAYFNLFSQRMLKMLTGLKREDLILERLLCDKGTIQNPYLASHIGANIVLWLPKTCLDEGLEALLSRCDPTLRVQLRRDRERHVNMEVFLGECLLRRKNTLENYADKQMATPDEKEVVEEEDEFTAPENHTPNYARMWLSQEAADVAWRKRKASGGLA